MVFVESFLNTYLYQVYLVPGFQSLYADISSPVTHLKLFSEAKSVKPIQVSSPTVNTASKDIWFW